MKKKFESIDEYIQNSPENIQQKLNELRDLIRSIVPSETVETMAYAIPTFKWMRNIIHFALAKNHIGIYPGPAAITAYAKELASFKTTKGSIHIPLDSPIPAQIIKKIVEFNVELLRK